MMNEDISITKSTQLELLHFVINISDNMRLSNYQMFVITSRLLYGSNTYKELCNKINKEI